MGYAHRKPKPSILKSQLLIHLFLPLSSTLCLITNERGRGREASVVAGMKTLLSLKPPPATRQWPPSESIDHSRPYAPPLRQTKKDPPKKRNKQKKKEKGEEKKLKRCMIVPHHRGTVASWAAYGCSNICTEQYYLVLPSTATAHSVAARACI